MKPRGKRISSFAIGMLLLCHALAGFAQDSRRLTIIVLIVDSLGPEALNGENAAMPQLQSLLADGVRVEASHGVYPPETLPNHAAILTGRYPENNGIASSLFWDRTENRETEPLSRPSELTAPTLFKRLKQSCPELKTAAVLSNAATQILVSECGQNDGYCGLHSLAPDTFFDPAAQPSFQPDVGRTTDVVTMAYARNYLNHADLMVINLGDADRAAEVKLASPFSKTLARAAALKDTDQRIAQLVADLEKIDRWKSTLLFVVSDRGLEAPLDHQLISFEDIAGPIDSERFQLAIQPTSASIYLKDRNEPENWRALRELAENLKSQPAIASTNFTSLHSALTDELDEKQIEALLLPADLHARHENLGELVISPAPGFRFEGANLATPGKHIEYAYPNHRKNTLLILGGVQFLTKGASIPQAESVDIAPTIAWLLGDRLSDEQWATNQDGTIKTDADGKRIARKIARYDGRPLTETFSLEQAPAKGSCGTPP